MNNDFYAEYLVSKRPSGGDTAKKVLIGLAALLLAAFFMLIIIFPLSILPAGLIIYGGYYLMTGIDTEYEYILTNGDLDIDKISGKRKRKRLITAKIGEFTSFGKLSEAPEEPDGCTTVLAGDGTRENLYYADFRHQSAGNVRLIFSPSDKILEGVGMFLPRQLRAEFNRNRGRYNSEANG